MRCNSAGVALCLVLGLGLARSSPAVLGAIRAAVSDDDAKYTLPKSFLLGAGTSAYQTEGAWEADGKGVNVFDHYYHQRNKSVQQTGDVAADSYHRYKEDIALAHELGLDTLRISLSWARILPTGRPDNVNKMGVQHYHDVLDEMKKYGIEPMVTIFHFDYPQTLEDEFGGWVNETMASVFADFADFVFREYGKKVKYWLTINEAAMYCNLAGAMGMVPPGTIDTEQKRANCLHNLILGHALAYRKYKEIPDNGGGMVGFGVGPGFSRANSTAQEDVDASDKSNQRGIGMSLHPLVTGDYPPGSENAIRPNFTEEQKKLLKGSIDFAGVNIYGGNNVSASSGGEDGGGGPPGGGGGGPPGGGGGGPPGWGCSSTIPPSGTTPSGSGPSGGPPTGGPPSGSPPTGGPPTDGPPTGGPPTGGPPTGGPPTGGPPTGGPPTGGPPSGSPPTGGPPSGSPPTGGPPSGSPPTGGPPSGGPPSGSPPTDGPPTTESSVTGQPGDDCGGGGGGGGGGPDGHSQASTEGAWTMREIPKWVNNKYNLPVFFTESGAGTGTGLDDWDTRAVFASAYLRELAAGINEDKNKVIGYTMWSLIDTFEFGSYDMGWGMVHVDYQNGSLNRTMKQSSTFFKRVTGTRVVPLVEAGSQPFPEPSPSPSPSSSPSPAPGTTPVPSGSGSAVVQGPLIIALIAFLAIKWIE